MRCTFLALLVVFGRKSSYVPAVSAIFIPLTAGKYFSDMKKNIMDIVFSMIYTIRMAKSFSRKWLFYTTYG